MKINKTLVKLNKDLIKSMDVSDEAVDVIKAAHIVLDFISNNPQVTSDVPVSDMVRGLEFTMQALWKFPQNPNFHRYQFNIVGCECPKLDNEDAIGSKYRWYNSDCKIHSAKLKPHE